MAKKALFIYTHLSTFVRGDLEILSTEFDIKEYQVVNSPKKSLPWSLLKLSLYLIFNIGKFEIVYIWFADYHSFLPLLFSRIAGKRSYLVIGGYDICRERRYKYGSFSNPLRSFAAISSIKMATMNLCVSKSVQRVIKAIAPSSRSCVVYNGVKTDFRSYSENPSQYNPAEERSHQEILCVALVSSLQSFYIKGIDRFNSVAQRMPDNNFVLVGCNSDVFNLAGIAPAPNLKILPRIDHSLLEEYYKNAKVYCQLSRRESFSLSLAEAMSYNCIPVITKTGGMPEVTGELGFQADGDDIDQIVQFVKTALISERSDVFRDRIIQHFSLKGREESLLKILTQL
ncbi:MAG: glycosyltransferase family 4 protein [Bacteroidales bacterium]|nr:glycosyltransferase family 4 protein [Bacteroidales bacterium]